MQMQVGNTHMHTDILINSRIEAEEKENVTGNKTGERDGTEESGRKCERRERC